MKTVLPDAAKHFLAVVVTGPRRAGKTTGNTESPKWMFYCPDQMLDCGWSSKDRKDGFGFLKTTAEIADRLSQASPR